ncbi:hypothetical protein [Klebsiella pneumoniae]|uniref:hypothetical protein n=1 Tax=Klebsiella pneumoniae TaxID=573 RepID=UPI002023B752|nr:hypothetical protein [Klebsiella pneumoniae]
MGEISVKTGNNARNGGKNSLNRLIRCVCGKKIGPDPRNFNQRVSLGRNDLLIRTFPNMDKLIVGTADQQLNTLNGQTLNFEARLSCGNCTAGPSLKGGNMNATVTLQFIYE